MRLILLSILTLTIWQTHAQIDLINRTSQRKDSNLIFLDISNIIEVTGIQDAAWTLKARNAQIYPSDSPRLFNVETDRLGLDTFQLFQRSKVMLTKIFRVVDWQNPTARWGALTKNSATIVELIANRRMVIFVPGCNCSREFRILHFKMTFVTEELPDAKKIVAVQGNILPEDAIPLIRQLHPGDKVIFSEIDLVGRNDRVRELPPFTITITAP